MSDQSHPPTSDPQETANGKLAKAGLFFQSVKGIVVSLAAIVAAVTTIWTGGCSLPFLDRLCGNIGQKAVVVSSATFRPIAPKNPIARHLEFENILVSVFFRDYRIEDAQKAVGALRQAGFKLVYAQSPLTTTLVPSKKPGKIWIKTTPSQAKLGSTIRSIILTELSNEDAEENINLAPSSLSASPSKIESRGEIQIQLY